MLPTTIFSVVVSATNEFGCRSAFERRSNTKWLNDTIASVGTTAAAPPNRLVAKRAVLETLTRPLRRSTLADCWSSGQLGDNHGSEF